MLNRKTTIIKKMLLVLLALIITGISYGQLTGMKAIPGTPRQPCNTHPGQHPAGC